MTVDRRAVVEELAALYARFGGATYGEGVTQLEHGLQAAAVAASEGAEGALIAAALLHDVGHLLGMTDDAFGYHRHDQLGADFLARHFGPAVTEPVRLHVAAKRYLCATVPGYFEKLSPASVYTLSKQGGPMNPDEVRSFARHPQLAAAVRVREWDDLGKVEGLEVRDFAHYRALLESLVEA
jgi:phosphonate degradation associated HDIG domain protein